MITTNVIQRTFHLKIGETTGTVFALDHDGRQYLVTAHHLLEGMNNLDSIRIFHNGKWKDLPCRMVGMALDADTAVLAPGQQLAPPFPLQPTMADMVFGQQVFFLGFPLGMMTAAGELNRDFPFPLVKSGVLSGIEQGTPPRIWVDAHNNPGFSGGPLIFIPPQEQFARNGAYRVAGLISGYRYSVLPVFNQQGCQIGTVNENTGIVLAHGIQGALDLINANPIGYQLNPAP